MTELFFESHITLNRCHLIKNMTPLSASYLATELARSDPWLRLAISESALKNYLLKTDTHLNRYVIENERQVIGVIAIRYPWLLGPYIELFGLVVEFRHLGLGSEILQWLETETLRQCKNLWVVSSSFNQKALQFYRGFGFKEIGILEGLIQKQCDEILLRKTLA